MRAIKRPSPPRNLPFNVSNAHFIREFSWVKMNFFTALTLCVIFLDLESVVGDQSDGSGLKLMGERETPFRKLSFYSRQTTRARRSSGFVITDCITVTSEEGRYYYKAYDEMDNVCGVYLLTDPDKVIEIRFEYFDVPCETGGRIAILDGWELDGEYFPSPQEHGRPLDDRYYEFCGMKNFKEKKTVLTSQNAGLVQYKLPRRGTAFSFSVRFMKTNTPCNILNEGKNDVYTLRNYGKWNNCSFISISPSKVKILAMNVGINRPLSPYEVETGSLHKCTRRGLRDAVLVGGNEGLDTTKLTAVVDTCGLDSIAQDYNVVIACNITTVKLISSGESDNSVTFMISSVEEEDLLGSSLICGL